ncbi:36428_t:CDS:1, partial [Gigaspora margarita]
ESDKEFSSRLDFGIGRFASEVDEARIDLFLLLLNKLCKLVNQVGQK